MSIIAKVIFLACGMLTSSTLIRQVSATNLFNESPSNPESSSRVIMKRKTAKSLQGQGKTEAEIDEIRNNGMSEIKKNEVVFESPLLDIQVVQVPEAAMQAFIDQQLNTGLFEYIEEDSVQSPAETTPNDPSFGSQWHHLNTTAGMKNVLAWDVTTGHPSITVAICDTGIQVNHPDLEANRAEGYNAITQQWESDGGDITHITDNTYDMTGHGTQVAGAAAAIGVRQSFHCFNL